MDLNVGAQTAGRQPSDEVRRWVLFIAIVAVVAMAGVAIGLVFAGPQRTSSSAGPCDEVTSSGCRPYLDELYAQLGRRGNEVASVRGRPWCGEEACSLVFGAETLRLLVTFHDGTTDEFSCWTPALGETSCRPATDAGQ